MRPGIRLLLVGVFAFLGFPLRASGQQFPPLAIAAREFADQWQRHDFQGIVGGGRVEIQLPEVAGSGPVPAQQAVVLLRGYVREAEELDTRVASAMEVTPVTAYVQLARRYRRQRVEAPLEETILLGLERSRVARIPGAEDQEAFGAWRVTVVQVVARGR